MAAGAQLSLIIGGGPHAERSTPRAVISSSARTETPPALSTTAPPISVLLLLLRGCACLSIQASGVEGRDRECHGDGAHSHSVWWGVIKAGRRRAEGVLWPGRGGAWRAAGPLGRVTLRVSNRVDFSGSLALAAIRSGHKQLLCPQGCWCHTLWGRSAAPPDPLCWLDPPAQLSPCSSRPPTLAKSPCHALFCWWSLALLS